MYESGEKKIGRPKGSKNKKRKMGRPKGSKNKIKVGQPKKQDVIVHTTLSENKRGRKSKTISTPQVITALKGLTRRVDSNELFGLMENAGTIPALSKKKEKLYKKALADRLFLLTRDGRVGMTKIGKRNHYYLR